MVRQLEAGLRRRERRRGRVGLARPDLPSGDELAAELERFLRDQGR